MRNAFKFASILFAALFSAQLSSLAQGSLTPPGPPGPTMVTLSQVQPRTPISSAPYTITTPGSYYLTTNIAGTPGNYGIIINTNDVTIDLNGFEMNGNGGISALYTPGNVTNLHVYNGSIRNWIGMLATVFNANNARFEKLRFSDGPGGLYTGSNCVIADCVFWNAVNSSIPPLHVGDGCIVKSCVVGGPCLYGILTGNNCVIEDSLCRSNNTGIKVGTNCTVRNCTVTAGSGTGIMCGDSATLTGCQSEANGGYGMFLANNSQVENCQVRSNNGNGFFMGSRCTLRHCDAINNVASGFSASSLCVFDGCQAVGNNLGNGISAGDFTILTGCNCRSNYSIGFYGGNFCRVQDCQVSANQTTGIQTGTSAQIINCHVVGNASIGIFINGGSSVSGCVCEYNTGSGIHINYPGCRVTGNTCNYNNTGNVALSAGIFVYDSNNLVEGNQLVGNTGAGIAVYGGYIKNVIIRNNAVANTSNYSIPSGNDVGPIGTAATSTSPFANISN